MAIHRTEFKITPSYIIGCGGMGTLAAYYCRQIALQELFKGDEMKLDQFRPVRYLAVDSSEQALRELGIPHNIRTISFGSEEIFNVLKDPAYPQVGNGVKAVKSLFPPDRDYEAVLNQLPDPTQGNSTCPPVGRMGFLANWESVYTRLKQEFQTSWGSPMSCDWPMEDIHEMNQIFILAGLYGGTGCGIHIDLAAMIRKIFRDLELPDKVIYGIFFLPDLTGAKTGAKDEMLRANAYAALAELDYFAAGNPYQVALANGQTLTVSMTGKDWLFNKIFLINDRNLRDVQLDEKEAARMVGTVVFHWCHTLMGSEINKRLQDRPTAKTTGWAPEKGNHRGERRPTAYSTFGFATAHIPYELLKHNLAVKFAVRTMNELLLLPTKEDEDPKTVQKRHETVYQRDFRIEEGMRELKLQEHKLAEEFRLSLPLFARRDSMEDFMEEIGEASLGKAFGEIRKEVARLMDPDAKSMDPDAKSEESAFSRITRFEQEFQQNLATYKDKLLDKFGPILTRRAIREIQERVRGMLQQQHPQSDESKDVLQSINKLLKKGQEFVENFEQNFVIQRLLTRKQTLRKFDQEVFSRLRFRCKKLQQQQLRDLKKRLLSRCLEVLDKQLKDLDVEEQRYHRVLEKLRKERREYSQEKTYFCPIPDEVMDDYLDNLHFRPEHRPETLAQQLRVNGLRVATDTGEQFIPVSQFDDYPELVVPQLIEEAKRIIEEAGITWDRPFSESGFYPLVEGIEGWYLRSYRRTWEELVKRSAPYLEYHDGGEFDTFEEAYIIYPGDLEQAKNPDKKSDERKRWEKESDALECNRSYPHTGVSPVSPYHISVLQMHYGLPIYSIDEITEWREALRKGLEDPVRRPYYKTNLPLEDPYIEIISDIRLSRSEVEELYDWAKNVSDKGWYRIFKKTLGKSTSFLGSNEKIVREFYFDLYEERYFPPEEIVQFARENMEFRDHLKTLAERLPDLISQKKIKASTKLRRSLDTFVIRSDDPNFMNGEEALELLQAILAELSKIQDLPAETGFRANGKALHVVADHHITGNLHSLVRNRFCEIRKDPPLKTGIKREQEIEELMTNPVFYRELVKKCVEALRKRPWLNNESLPKLLREDS